MAGSRARRLRRQMSQQGQQGQQAQTLAESTTYSELLATTIPPNSNQNADKVAQTLGIVQNGRQGWSPYSNCRSPPDSSLFFYQPRCTPCIRRG